MIKDRQGLSQIFVAIGLFCNKMYPSETGLV